MHISNLRGPFDPLSIAKIGLLQPFVGTVNDELKRLEMGNHHFFTIFHKGTITISGDYIGDCTIFYLFTSPIFCSDDCSMGIKKDPYFNGAT